MDCHDLCHVLSLSLGTDDGTADPHAPKTRLKVRLKHRTVLPVRQGGVVWTTAQHRLGTVRLRFPDISYRTVPYLGRYRTGTVTDYVTAFSRI